MEAYKDPYATLQWKSCDFKTFLLFLPEKRVKNLIAMLVLFKLHLP